MAVPVVVRRGGGGDGDGGSGGNLPAGLDRQHRSRVPVAGLPEHPDGQAELLELAADRAHRLACQRSGADLHRAGRGRARGRICGGVLSAGEPTWFSVPASAAARAAAAAIRPTAPSAALAGSILPRGRLPGLARPGCAGMSSGSGSSSRGSVYWLCRASRSLPARRATSPASGGRARGSLAVSAATSAATSAGTAPGGGAAFGPGAPGQPRWAAGERRRAGQAFPRDHAEGVQVAGRGGRLARDPFLGQVGGRAEQRSRARDRRRPGHAGDPEVGDLHLAAGAEQQVPRLDVAVHQARPVRGSQAGSQTRFARLQRRLGVRHPGPDLLAGVPVSCYILDVLWADERDVRPVPLRERKRILRDLLAFTGPLRFTGHTDTDGEAYFRQACSKGWEGVIAKRADAPYRAGP